jgi:hypothetical protein
VLAEAAASHRAAVERLERIERAVVNAREASMDARDTMEGAEAALAEAEGREQRRVVAVALGEPAPVGPNLEQARTALAAAQATHRRARQAIALLEEERVAAEPSVAFAAERVRVALADLLAEEGIPGKLFQAYDAHRARAEQIAEVLRSLGLTLLGQAYNTWSHPQRPIPPHASLVPQWQAVLQKLRDGEADTPFPTIS